MISLEDIRELARLARLKLTTQEQESLQKNVSSILDYVGQVSVVPMQGSKQDAGVVHNVMRADTPRAVGVMSGKGPALIQAFPKSDKGYNVVRKIIEKD